MILDKLAVKEGKSIILSQSPAEVYSEPYQTCKNELFIKIVNGFQPLTVFAKSSILNT